MVIRRAAALGILVVFIAMRYQVVNADLMSLGDIAIGTMAG